MSEKQSKPMANQLLHQPVEFKQSLSLLEDEMNKYKEGIIEGTITLDAPTAVLFQEAINDLSNPAFATTDDIEFHTSKLKDARLKLEATKGDDEHVDSDN